MASLGLGPKESASATPPEPAKESAKLIPRAEIVREVQERDAKGATSLSLCVVGHVDAGKSTLLGRLLVELGELTAKEHEKNERQSGKEGKGSFAYAWAMDALSEERARGVTLDFNLTNFRLPTTGKRFALVDTPGHAHLVHNMISGASQADAALLVVDARKGEFESGFSERGQTREHALLVRALGVRELAVLVNKLDAVGYSQARFEQIVDELKPFLLQCGFSKDSTTYVPVAAFTGENLIARSSPVLEAWYDGPTLVEVLDRFEDPKRPYDAPLRLPLHNVFKGQTALASGVGVSGRLASGIVQVGERVRVLPGDETAVVRLIEEEDESVPWAVAGSNVTLYLAGIDPIHLAVGSVLCPPSQPVPLVTRFNAQIILFDVELPITPGTAVELYEHSTNLPATITSLIATLDRSTGAVIKNKPRVLTKSASARVEITLRSGSLSTSGGPQRSVAVPLEPFSINKDMGRVLLRRGGASIAAGVVLDIFG